MLRQDEVVVGELAHLAEHDEHAAAVVAPRKLERRHEQRAVAGRAGGLAELGREALVLEELRCGEHTAGADGVDERRDAAQLALERLGLRLGELGRPASSSPSAPGISTAPNAAANASQAAWASAP